MINDTDHAAAAPANAEMTKRSKQKPGKAKHTKTKAVAVSVLEETAPDRASVPTGESSTVTVEQLASQIRGAMKEADLMASTSRQSADMAIESALRAGQLLIEAKRRIGHGGWEKWMADSLPDISQSTACRYMRLASKLSRVTDLKDPVSLVAAYRACNILPERAKSQGVCCAEKDRPSDGRTPTLPGKDNEEATAAPPASEVDADQSEPSSACAPVPAAAAAKPDNPAPETRSPITTGDDDVAPRMARPTVEGIIRAAADLREMIGLIWDGGVRLTLAQSRELHATEKKLREFREKMGGAEGRALTEDDNAKR